MAIVKDVDGDANLLIRPTIAGDLNLDGVVTISDFIDLASNFNQLGVTWQEGDINYDGAVTISDLICCWHCARCPTALLRATRRFRSASSCCPSSMHADPR